MIVIDTKRILEKTGVAGVAGVANRTNLNVNKALRDKNLPHPGKNSGVAGVALGFSTTYETSGDNHSNSKTGKNSQLTENKGATPCHTAKCGSLKSNKNYINDQVINFATPATPATPKKQWGRKCTSAFTNFSDPETPGHHWLCPERGWIQSAVEKKPHGYLGQTLTNPTDSDELVELLEWERAHADACSISCDREPANRVLSVDAPLTDPLANRPKPRTVVASRKVSVSLKPMPKHVLDIDID